MYNNLHHAVSPNHTGRIINHLSHHTPNIIQRNFAFNSEIVRDTYPGKNITRKLNEHLPNYLSEIEDITNKNIPKVQKDKIYDYLNNNQIIKLNSDQSNKHRREFDQYVKQECRKNWEINTGMPWPTYNNDFYIKGKIVRKKGSNYDAHHIIENTYNGPHQWWNMHPASYSEHHKLIHGSGSYAQRIFE